MTYAVYIRDGGKWCLIGFNKNLSDARQRAITRLKVLSKKAEWNYKKVRQLTDAPEYLTKLRKKHDI